MSSITIGFIIGLTVSTTIHLILNEIDRKKRIRQYQQFLNNMKSAKVGFVVNNENNC